MIADDVDEPWNPTRIFRDPVHRRIGEHIQVARARDAQPGPDILARFARGQRRDLAAQPDPLLELLELGEVELGLELRLTHEQDLQELVRRGLEVREQPDLFQRRGVEVLRFVEDEDGVLAGPFALDEEVVQRDEPPRLRRLAIGNPKVREDVLENAVKRERGVEDEGDRGLSVEPLPKGVEQGGLSRAHLAGQDHEAFALLDTVLELGERLLMPRTHVEEFGIRGRVEGLLAESVEGQVHATALRSQHFGPRARRGTRFRGRRSRRC